MKRLPLVCVVAWLAMSCARASSTEAAIVAAMRLSDQPNYSWVATVSDDARTYDIVGKTVRGGFTWVRMPVINAVRRQLGRSVTDPDVDMIFRGNVACVIETERGWSKPDELRSLDLNDSARRHMPPSTGHAPLLGSHSSTSRMRGSIIPVPSSARSDNGQRGYSNLQLAISHPHEELGVIVSSHQELKVEGDTVTGVLSDLGAQLLLVRDGQEDITPMRASGTFKLWLRAGMVVKYQVRLEGTLEVQSSGSRRQINVSQVTDTVLKDIGTTKFEVPMQARAKLGV